MKLDSVNEIEINIASPPTNELNRLSVLGEGLSSIYATVRNWERQLAPPPGRTGMFMGSIPGLPMGLLECMFHWYALSLYNYVSLVAHLGNVQDKVHYREEVCRQALAFRNKVAAHFALTSPRDNDNQADLDYSVMNFPSLVDDRFKVGAWVLTRTTAGVSTSTSHDTYWSLTEHHEELALRYPEHFRIPPDPANDHPSDGDSQNP